MKKLVSMLLVTVMAFSTLLMSVYAKNTEDTIDMPAYIQLRSDEDVLDMALELWPEHADNLMCEDVKPLTRSADNPVVLRETYQLSEHESITYVEYANGFAVAQAVSNWVYDGQTTGTGYQEYTGNYYVTNGMSTAHLIGFKFRVYTGVNTYDRIVDFGYMHQEQVDVKEHGRNAVETATTPAYYTYQVYFMDHLDNVYGSCIANLRVQKDAFSHYAY